MEGLEFRGRLFVDLGGLFPTLNQRSLLVARLILSCSSRIMCSRFDEGSPADLERLGIVDEVAGHERDRVFGRRRYPAILAQGTHPSPPAA